MREHSFTQEQLALRIGKSRPFVANMLRLLHLENAVQDLVSEGALTGGHARALLKLGGAAQVEAAKKVAASGLSVRQTEEMVRKISSPQARYKKDVGGETACSTEPSGGIVLPPPVILDVEEALREALGTQVRIKGSDRGRIEIEFYDLDDLERIADVIMKNS